MNISDAGIKLIKHFEGYKNKPYKCSARVWTIGIGSAMYHEQLKLKLEDRDQIPLKQEDNRVWSDEEIINLFKKDIRRFELGVNRLITIPLKQCEFDALVSFSFNLGLGTLQRSSVRSNLNRGNKEEAIKKLLLYCRGGGKILKGLQLRRQAEAQMFFGK